MYRVCLLHALVAWTLTIAALLAVPSRALAAPGDEVYAVAAGFYARQEWQRAADEFKDLLARFPGHERTDSARYFRAESLVQLGQNGEARTEFAEFLAAYPKHRLARQALFRAGEAAFLSGANEEAERDLEQFRQRYPQDSLNAYALGYLGEVHLAATRWEDARAVFQDALKRFPEGPLADECRFGAGRACEHQQEFGEAERYYQSLAANKQSPLADDAQLQRALLAYHRERYSETIAALKSFDDEFPQSNLKTHARYWLGMSLAAREDWKKAAEAFVVLAKEAPRHELTPAIEFAAGEALRKGGRLLDALPHYDRVLKGWPQSEWADDSLQAKIQAALEAGLDLPLDSLAEQFDQAYPESPLRPAVRLALGRWQLMREAYADAVAPLRDYLEAMPDGADSAKCRAQLITALSGAKEFAEASQALEELGRRDPQEKLLPATTLHLADASYAAKEWDLAGSLYERAAKDGNPPEIVAKGLAGLARVQSQREGGKKSAETLSRIIAEQPESAQAPQAALQRAKEFEKLGQAKEALEAYQLLLEKYPRSKQVPQALLSGSRLAQQLEQLPAAAELLERLVSEHGDAPFADAALYQYAWLLSDLKRETEAAETFARLSKGHRESRYWADATFRVAEHAVGNKDYEHAEKLVAELLNSNCEGEIRAHVLYLQGQVAIGRHRWPDVAEPLTRLLKDYATSDVALPAEYWLAETHYRLGELDRAYEEFSLLAKKAVGRDDGWLAMIPLRLAQILGHRKEWAEAFDLAEGISTSFPDFRQQYEVDYLLGRCLGSRGEFDAARTAYERVIRSTAGGRTETAAMAQWMIGESYFHQRNYDEAVKAYQRVERLFAYPRWQAGSVLQAGKCYEAQGDWKRAVQLYAQLLKDYPDTTFTEEARERLRAAQDRAAKPAGQKK